MSTSIACSKLEGKMRNRRRVYFPFGLLSIFFEQIVEVIVPSEIERGQESEENEATNYASCNFPPSFIHSSPPSIGTAQIAYFPFGRRPVFSASTKTGIDS
jgi:hypothetical protein